ncbi:(Fe-S)-binding protein [Ornithinibacillus contaminans]|uniref:(Fe-S)-binding protein n=1 Tax=Ornithinibacillus contaminans TaxID=694055 RepID=UPI00064E1227|nr:(Fe-S)-binding protein [Ornithinibacillus contaminans]
MSSTLFQERIQKGFQENLAEEKLLDCMRCGFCLPACPTYIHSNYDEVQSPRGRIALMKAVRDGDIPFDDSVQESLDLCLGCRACEPACPAGVEYGHLLEHARDVIQREKKASIKEKAIRKVAFDNLFQDPSKMSKAVGLVRFYQNSGLQSLTRKMNILSFFPEILKEMEKVLPPIEKKSTVRGKTYEPENDSIKVAFFTGCLMETIFSKTNDATIKLLQKLGCQVWVPEGQVCCGALHGHSGELEKARENAKKNLDSFLEKDVDYIVNNAGGCGAFLSEYDSLLKDDPEYLEKAKRFAEKTIDITSLLFKLGITNRSLTVNKEESLIVTYQDSCHLRNVNHVIDEPREILKSIKHVDYIELKGAEHCCGSAGIYNLIHSEMSMRILDNRMENVTKTGAKIIITTNPGCLLQMKLGIERAGLTGEMEAIHLVDFLYEKVFDSIG